MSRLLTLHDPGEARAYYAAGLWRTDTLYGLAARHARERGNAFAIRDPYRRLTWRQLVEEVDRVAGALHATGINPGDRVSVWMANRVEAVIVFLACSRNGYVFNTSLHQSYTVAEVMTLLERVGCRALFAQIGWGADAAAVDIFAPAQALPDMECVFALRPQIGDVPTPPGTLPFPGADAPPPPPPPAADDPDQVVYLAFTSGTTGAPKGVMHSANSLLANARAMVEDWGHDHRTVLLSLSQLSHHIGTVALDQVLAGGMELVLYDPGAGIDPLTWIEETGATYVMGVPTHAIDILAALRRSGRDRLGNVRTFYMAGALIPTETAAHLLSLGVKPQNIYGMTENGSHHYTMPDDAPAVITRTCGRACNAYEIRLFKPDQLDVEVAPGEVGEIGGRGAMRMLGYFANQEATERSFNAGGWFMSGDLGRLDEEGNLQIVGRQKDIIIRGGHNIHPARIEDLAMRHPLVSKAAAVPVADQRLGEKVCLLVTSKGDEPPSGEALLGHLDALGLSRFDMPEYFAVLDAFPLGPTGKILKRELVTWVRDGRLAPEPVRWSARQGTAA
jgi:acyl-CoA synthetase